MPIVSLIITPDKIRPSPIYPQQISDEHADNPRTEMSYTHLGRMIEGVYSLAKEACVRKDHRPHTCVHIDTRSYDYDKSVHVTVVYGLECLLDSLHQKRFIEAVKNCMNHGRAASLIS